MRVNDADLDLIRQWFNAVEDLNPKYLEPADYALAERLGIGPEAQRAKRATARARALLEPSTTERET